MENAKRPAVRHGGPPRLAAPQPTQSLSDQVFPLQSHPNRCGVCPYLERPVVTFEPVIEPARVIEWIAPGDGLRAFFRVHARAVLTVELTEARVDELLDFAGLLKARTMDLEPVEARSILAAVIAELTS